MLLAPLYRSSSFFFVVSLSGFRGEQGGQCSKDDAWYASPQKTRTGDRILNPQPQALRSLLD
jgi:hypothetical protein